jgi:23S rRNA (guanosine2251-2'-O)-methyltransferase
MKQFSPRFKGPAPLYPNDWRAIIGQHAITEALRLHPQRVKSLWLQQGWESSHDLKVLHSENKNKISKIEIKPESILAKVGNSHQGAVLFMDYTPEFDFEKVLAAQQARIILLDGIEDPHNLGAILRTSWLMNVDGILLPQDRSVKLTPTVHKVACGGVEHVPVEICSNFSSVLERFKENDFWIFGLSHEGRSTVFDIKIPQKIVWCIGAEDKGLRKTTERLCDELVRIPQASAAASYNASVATGMAMLETHRQQSLFHK